MAETVNIQDEFLKRARNEKIPVVVFLTNKVQLHGILAGFDRFVVLLDATGKQQMVYKHAITTITPSVPITNLKIFRSPQQEPEA
ncbi:MAG: RNA chaperone Hfq [bacterium]